MDFHLNLATPTLLFQDWLSDGRWKLGLVKDSNICCNSNLVKLCCWTGGKLDTAAIGFSSCKSHARYSLCKRYSRCKCFCRNLLSLKLLITVYSSILDLDFIPFDVFSDVRCPATGVHSLKIIFDTSPCEQKLTLFILTCRLWQFFGRILGRVAGNGKRSRRAAVWPGRCQHELKDNPTNKSLSYKNKPCIAWSFGHLIKMKLKHGKSEKRVMKQVDLKGDATKQLHGR